MPTLPNPVRNPKATIYIGIDPGASGGIAWIEGTEVQAVKMPSTEHDIFDALHEIVHPVKYRGAHQPTVHASIEKVHAMPKQGVSSTFKFGVNYGLLRGMLVALRVPFEEPTPQRWIKRLEIPNKKKSETPTQWKNRLKGRAQQLFPQVKITLSTSDALLIAEYTRREKIINT